jgi:hypothetical protein
MDFNQLMIKMRELDQPTTEAGCGMDAPMTPPPLSAVPPKPDTPPPSMSVNINAQGMENIEDMMKLFQKVNPDMGPKEPMPSLGMEPSIMSIKPSLPPLKMLPDMDADNDEMPGGEKDHMEPDADNFGGPSDNDADNKPEDDEDKKKEKDEEFANEPDTDIKDIDYMNNKLAGGMNRPKDTYPKVADGDNPMKKNKFESGDLRSQIRAELLQRLAEAKGAK